MKKNRIFVLVIVLFLIALLIGVIFYANKPNNKMKIVTTLFPLYDIAKSIGNDKVEVTLLIPPGVEAHTYEPKPSDIVKINESDIFIYTGGIMEPWVADIINSITDNTTTIVNASKGILGIKDSTNNQIIDPHFWLDFMNMIKITNSIAKAINLKDPTNKEYYTANIDTYVSQLNALIKDFRKGLSKCESNTIIYTGHSAFEYFEKRYGISFSTAYGPVPNAEASAQDIVKLVDQVKKDNIKYIYYEKLVGSQFAQTLADETGAIILPLNPVDNITKEEFDSNATFDSIMRINLENIKTGLKCQ